MKKGIILSFKKFELLNYVTQNKIIILLTFVYIIGLIIGSTTLSKDNQIMINANNFLNDYLTLHNTANFFNKTINIFIRNLAFLLLYYLCGASMFGVVAVPFLLFWQGILFGASASQLYILHGIYGVAFNAIILIPPTTIFVICCLVAAKNSINFSLFIAKLSLPNAKPLILYNHFKKYCGIYLILVGLILISAFSEIILNILFLKFFNFI